MNLTGVNYSKKSVVDELRFAGRDNLVSWEFELDNHSSNQQKMMIRIILEPFMMIPSKMSISKCEKNYTKNVKYLFVM